MSKLCIIPNIQAFLQPDGTYRDCCSTDPWVTKHETNFENWWSGKEMFDLRESVDADNLPEHCRRCSQAKQSNQDSMLDVGWRAINGGTKISKLPSRYQIGFSNVCNLGCWSCHEGYSSVIQEEKRKLKILPEDFVDPSIAFNKSWPSLRDAIIKSYDEHDEILLNIFGGEPTVSRDLFDFLQQLVDLGLNTRTRLEMFSNCHAPKQGFFELLENNKWKHITILASIDAIGKANDWIRYGSDWDSVFENFHRFNKVSDYLEVQTTLSVLNARHLPEVSNFCKLHNVQHVIQILKYPWFLDPVSWDGPLDILGDLKEYQSVDHESTWNLFKSDVKTGSSQALKEHIKKFSDRRTDVSSFNPVLNLFINS